MSSYIRYELYLFLRSACGGAVLHLCYDILTGLRRVIPHSPAAVACQDILYWLGAGLAVSAGVYRFNQGILRGFLFGGILLGAGLCHLTLSPVFLALWTKLLQMLELFIKFSANWLLFFVKRCKLTMYLFAKRGEFREKIRFWRLKRGSRSEGVRKKIQQKKNSK